ncbi:MAG TPA: DNA-binding response regulator, partial [Ruminococcaceae bacterium]|nr:DNA-binding response regulator [Oscillospiraceae bacterium]
TIRIIVCDDSERERSRYVELCRELAAKHHLEIETKAYDNGIDLLFDLENPKFFSTVDILMLDINMPGINGVNVAKEARKCGYKGIIVFITVSTAHYENAFDVRAFNYITKGKSSAARFEEVFLNAVEAAKELRQEVIMLSGGGEFRQIPVKDIFYFEIVKRIITVHYKDESFEFVSTFEKLENQLFERGFLRIHRAYLVSLAHVKSITYEEVTMTNGALLPVGRKYYAGLKKALSELALT